MNDESRTVIEILGEKYELINDKQSGRSKPSRMATILAATVAMSGMYAGIGGSGGEKMPSLPLDYLIREFTLIQKKESSLTRRERHWVTIQFNKHFRKSPTP